MCVTFVTPATSDSSLLLLIIHSLLGVVTCSVSSYDVWCSQTWINFIQCSADYSYYPLFLRLRLRCDVQSIPAELASVDIKGNTNGYDLDSVAFVIRSHQDFQSPAENKYWGTYKIIGNKADRAKIDI